MPAGLPLIQARRIAADSSSPDCRWLMPAGRRWQGKPTHFLNSRRRLRLTDPAVRGRSRRRPWGKPTHRRRLPLVRGESQPAVRSSLGPQPVEAPSSPPAPAVEWSSQPAAAVIVKPAGYGFASRPLPNLTSQPAVAVFDQTVTKVFLTVSVFSPGGLLIPLSFPRKFWGGGVVGLRPKRLSWGLGPRSRRRSHHGLRSHARASPWPPELLLRHGLPSSLLRHGLPSSLLRHGPPELPAPPGPLSVCSTLEAPSCVCICVGPVGSPECPPPSW